MKRVLKIVLWSLIYGLRNLLIVAIIIAVLCFALVWFIKLVMEPWGVALVVSTFVAASGYSEYTKQ